MNRGRCHNGANNHGNDIVDEDNEEDMESLMRLYKMAQETMSYCEGRLRKLQRSDSCGNTNKRGREALSDHNKGSASGNLKPKGSKSNHNFIDERETIGGIPKKFLDLRHFPQFDSNKKLFTKEEAAHVIADENVQSNTYQPGTFGDSLPLIRSPGSAPRANYSPRNSRSSSPNNLGRKLPKNALSISSPLSHINGTYIQEGTFNNSPLFVRVGPPRKFMGFDCCVVLRRESTGCGDANGNEGAVWKIGLVPSHTITHPRLIGYYEAVESQDGEPPVEGWKVPNSVKKVGGLKILYEE